MLNIANILCPVFVHSHRFLKLWKQLAVKDNFVYNYKLKT
jgi:hypothetical protein